MIQKKMELECQEFAKFVEKAQLLVIMLAMLTTEPKQDGCLTYRKLMLLLTAKRQD